MKYSLFANPMFPSYSGRDESESTGGAPSAHIEPFSLASHVVTNAEFQAFVDDGGYCRPEFWLAHGWTMVEQKRWQHPLYWHDCDGQ